MTPAVRDALRKMIGTAKELVASRPDLIDGTDLQDWLLRAQNMLDEKPDHAREIYWAFRQGLHVGHSEFGNNSMCCYSVGSVWRAMWYQGFAAGKNYWRYEEEIKQMAQVLDTSYRAIANTITYCEQGHGDALPEGLIAELMGAINRIVEYGELMTARMTPMGKVKPISTGVRPSPPWE